MKKTGRRLLSLLLALLTALAVVPFSAAAAGESGCSVMLESREPVGGEVPSCEEVLPVELAAPEAGETMYSQLDQRQQACYDAIADVTPDELKKYATVRHDGLTYRRRVLHISGMDGLVLNGSVSNGEFRPSGTSVAVEKQIYTDLCAAIVALRYDRPDLLWIGDLHYGYKTQAYQGANQVVGVLMDYYLEYNGEEGEMYDAMMASAREIAEQASQAADTYQKVLFVHDRLLEMNTYGDTEEPRSHTAYSALIAGDEYEPVCDGYAKAFKIICDLMGIPCAMPATVSGDHRWNNVKMDDSEWYNVDLTWDDGAEDPHKYFLVGSQTEIDGTAFSQQPQHKEENPYESYRKQEGASKLNPITLSYPRKNEKAYKYLGRDYPPMSFPDVKYSDWFFEDVEAVLEKELFGGDADGRFAPRRSITRAEFAKVMANLMKADLTGYGGTSYPDVDPEKWYAPAVAWAKEHQVMNGDKKGTFRPEDSISRQEMCVVLANTMSVLPEAGDFRFPDDAEIAGWARDAVYACYALGVLRGDTQGRCSPKADAPRSEAAAVFNRFTNLEK